MKIYTDGSFNRKLAKNSTAYAAVIVVDETDTEYVVDIVYGVITDPAYVGMWNVGGEIWAVLAGLDYAISKYNPNEISLYYDYAGLGNWVNGSWKTKNPATTSYANYVRNVMNERPVAFNKVIGHTNVLLNDLADKYANNGTLNYLKNKEYSSLASGLRISKSGTGVR